MLKSVVWILLAQSALFGAETGESLFRTHCAPCHGAKGDGGRGANLAVRKLPRAPDDAALGNIINLGIAGTAMPPTRMTDAERTLLIAFVRGLGRAQTVQAIGNIPKGEELFWSKGNCGQCHTVGPRGGRLGPDLTEIGGKRSPAYLRISLLEPEAEVPEGFAFYRKVIYMPDNFLRVRAMTADGKQITGVRVDEDTFTIQIRDDADHLYSFRKDELRDLQKDWGKSPMPSFKGVLSEDELQDLVAYLASLRGTP